MEKKRILVVDDEVDLLFTMRGVLASWGYDVITAATGREAIRIVKDGPRLIDIIIMDIMMPDLDGIATLRRIRRFNKEIPVLMLTGYPSNESFKETKRLGISGFISKGTEFIESARIIKAAIKSTKKCPKKRQRKAADKL